LHSDNDCSVKLTLSTHHVIYRDTWSASLHAEYLQSCTAEPALVDDDTGVPALAYEYGAAGWPTLRSFPFGSGFDGGNLSVLAAQSVVRADERRLLFACRGTLGWGKPSRQQLADFETAHRERWTAMAERLMAHAPPLGDLWPLRYVVDFKETEYVQMPDGNWTHHDLWPYATAGIFSYVDLMREAVFTLSPPGDLWEAYRTWEAIEAGSIPVVVDNSSYKENGCVRPATHLLATAPFVVSVRSWEELPDVLERVAANPMALVARQEMMATWLARRKADLRAGLISTSYAMSRPASWRPRTACTIVPLSPHQVAEQRHSLASFWRESQRRGVNGPWMESGWGASSIAVPFRGEDGMCEKSAHGLSRPEDFTEKCKTTGCTPPLVAAFNCTTAAPAEVRATANIHRAGGGLADEDLERT